MSAGYVMPYQMPPHRAPSQPSLRLRTRDGPSAVRTNRECLVALAERLRDSRFDSLQGLATSSILVGAGAESPTILERRRAPAQSMREAA